MKPLGIEGTIVFAIGIILILITSFYRATSNLGVDIFNFIGIFLDVLGVAMIVASTRIESKQTPS
jgi:hypothetical protein